MGRHFTRSCRPNLIGDPHVGAAKLFRLNDELGAGARVNFQMSSRSGEQAAMRRSIELLGNDVSPLVRRCECDQQRPVSETRGGLLRQ
jgi:hypothetical protein